MFDSNDDYNNYDVDGEDMDLYDDSFDSDGDGVDDVWGLDMDGDGEYDTVAIDTNGDGIADMWDTDTDGDGIVDMHSEDTNYDGIDDLWSIDEDGDGIIDISAADTDYDGYAESLDSNGDGYVDQYTSFVDLDGDGIDDQAITEADTDYDGVTDVMAVETDTDGDGYVDTLEMINDYNQDGMIDDVTVHSDTDGDGIVDTVYHEYDSDGDGEANAFTMALDFDDDGEADYVETAEIVDTDGDGEADTYVHNVDTDGDGVYDVTEAYAYDETLGILQLDAVEPITYVPETEEYAVPDDVYDDFENFDPDDADPDAVSGNPAEAMEEWEFQGDTNRCALYSQKFVIEELTDEDIDIEEFADIAEEQGWFDEENGTSILNMNKMLDYYGIENEMSFNNDIDDIKDVLDNGGKVIVSIDADEIWYGDDDNVFTPGESSNHAVEVIGIDYSDPENPMVILNDSGHPDGCGSMVPLDEFVDAWEDGNCQMIECM